MDLQKIYTDNDFQNAVVPEGQVLLFNGIENGNVVTRYKDSSGNFGTLSGGGGTDTSDATALASDIAEGKTAYIATGKVTGTASLGMNFYKCTSVDTANKTWSGYLAVLGENGLYSFADTVTEGLTYGTAYTPVYGSIYSADAAIMVSKLWGSMFALYDLYNNVRFTLEIDKGGMLCEICAQFMPYFISSGSLYKLSSDGTSTLVSEEGWQAILANYNNTARCHGIRNGDVYLVEDTTVTRITTTADYIYITGAGIYWHIHCGALRSDGTFNCIGGYGENAPNKYTQISSGMGYDGYFYGLRTDGKLDYLVAYGNSWSATVTDSSGTELDNWTCISGGTYEGSSHQRAYGIRDGGKLYSLDKGTATLIDDSKVYTKVYGNTSAGVAGKPHTCGYAITENGELFQLVTDTLTQIEGTGWSSIGCPGWSFDGSSSSFTGFGVYGSDVVMFNSTGIVRKIAGEDAIGMFAAASPSAEVQ